MNKVTLIGRVTKEIEVKYTSQGTAFASFSLAVDRKKDKDGNKQTDFIPCVAWSKLAEVIGQYVHKGNRLAVDGRLQSRQYESNGQKRTAYDVVVNDIDFLEPKSNQQGQQKPSQQDWDEQIPF